MGKDRGVVEDRSQVSAGKIMGACTKRETRIEELKLDVEVGRSGGKHPTWIHSVAGTWKMRRSI
jgi:hypothetical protein